MRILLIHSDYFEYEVREKAIPEAEPISEDRKKDSMKEVLVSFCTVEKEDELNPDQISKKTAEEISSVAQKVKAKNIMVYPYAHLSSSLASPKGAVKVLKLIEEDLSRMGYNVKRSPFGWYKSFRLECKGHPLAELSRTISLEELKEKPKKREIVKKPSKYLILDVDGKEHPFDLSVIDKLEILNKYPLLKQFIISEEIGRMPGQTPPHIKLMRRLELVDYEPASDIGHFRFYPKGAMLKELLEKFADQIADKIGALRIETPLIYRLERDIAEQASRFLERDYRFRIDNKELVLRFAGDFGLFKMMSSAIISYKNLPLRIYELSQSFRYEKRGECVGLRRLRAFTMPDIHCFCKDLRQGMDEYKWLFKHYTELANSMEIDYIVAFRVVEEFYRENKEWFKEMIKIVNKPALIELLPEMKHYWVVKHEY
ncbi:threonine--tRNA ligase, partial [Candidatus Geothermarchaeota archaeon]